MVNRSVAAGGRDLARLRRRLQGQVLLPDEHGYHRARRVWNAMVDRRPAVIARCAGPADVAAAIGFATPMGWSWGCAAAATACSASRCPRPG
jgi:hypothetical protein